MDNVTFTVEDRRKQGYFTVDNVLLDVYGAQLGPHGIAVYVALARFANKDSECWPSYRTITERTGVSRRQITREIAKMAELRIIEVVQRFDDKGNRMPHLYILLEIAGGGATQTPGVVPGGHQGSATQAHKQSLLKKDTLNSNKKGKNYRPDEYSDIILG